MALQITSINTFCFKLNGARSNGNPVEAEGFYEEAIKCAVKENFIQETAIANDFYADFISKIKGCGLPFFFSNRHFLLREVGSAKQS